MNGSFDLNLKCENSVSGFLPLMFKTMRLGNMQSIEDFTDLMKRKKIVLIIHNV